MDQALQRQTSRSDDNQGLEEHCDLHIYRFIGAKKLSDLTVPACNAFADQLRDAGRSAETITPLRNEFRWPWDVGRRCVENSKRAFGRCAWCFPFSTPSALAVLVRSAPGDVFACFGLAQAEALLPGLGDPPVRVPFLGRPVSQNGSAARF